MESDLLLMPFAFYVLEYQPADYMTCKQRKWKRTEK